MLRKGGRPTSVAENTADGCEGEESVVAGSRMDTEGETGFSASDGRLRLRRGILADDLARCLAH